MSKQDAVEQVANAVHELQDATDLVDELAARYMGLNRTDLRCVSRLSALGPQAATELAAAAGLTGGAMTTAIDRIERAGFAVRVRDPSDRRRVTVALTDRAESLTAEIWGPILEDARTVLNGLTDGELAIVNRFLALALANQQRQAERLRGLSPSASGATARAQPLP